MSTRGKKLTTEEFKIRAKLIHNDKFDYSLVEYKNAHTKVRIICPVHGEFEQIPMDHLKGSGCYACSGKKQHSLENFIKEATLIHQSNGDTYDYSLVNYKNLDTKVKIVCPTHGEFSISPRSVLLQKAGCVQCGLNRAGLNKRTTQFEFIAQANKIHNEKYIYSKVEYNTSTDKVIIICPTHGDFHQTPNSHLNQKSGCPECALENRGGIGGYTNENFEKHPEYKKIPAILYSALITNGNEQFIKIGITAKSTQFRFSRTEYKEMNIEVLYEKSLPLYEAFQIEQQFIEEMKSDKFFSNTKFSGYTECFKINEKILTRINEIFQIKLG